MHLSATHHSGLFPRFLVPSYTSIYAELKPTGFSIQV